MNWQTSEFGWNGIMGVYCVVSHNPTTRKNKILYIGSSQNIGKRLFSNKHPYKILYEERTPAEIIFIKYKETLNYIELEKRMIKKIKPLYNTQFNG